MKNSSPLEKKCTVSSAEHAEKIVEEEAAEEKETGSRRPTVPAGGR
jgi:hypothetical protein